MFSLLYGLWELLFRKPQFHVLIVGPDGAGKTTLLERLKVQKDALSLPFKYFSPLIAGPDGAGKTTLLERLKARGIFSPIFFSFFPPFRASPAPFLPPPLPPRPL